MNIFLKILGVIVSLVSIIGTGYTINHYYFEKKKFSLEYNLSSPVQISYADSFKNNDFVYELDIKNTGKERIHDIRIKINVGVIKLVDKKLGFSNQKLTILPNKNVFEAIYSELNVRETLKLSLQAPLLVKEIISISYPQGLAVHKTSKNWETIWFSLFIGLLVFVIFSAFSDFSQDLWIHNAYAKLYDSQTLKEIFSIKKPWYISKSKFNRYRADIVRLFWKLAIFKFSEDKIFSETFAYMFLSCEKPNYLSNDEWLISKNYAEKYLLEIIKFINNYNNLKAILQLSKPKNCNCDFWSSKIIPSASRKCRECYIYDVLEKISIKSLENQAKLLENSIENIPPSLLQNDQEEVQNILEHYYCNAMCGYMIENKIDVKKLSSFFKLSLLSSSKRELLKHYGEKIAILNRTKLQWNF